MNGLVGTSLPSAGVMRNITILRTIKIGYIAAIYFLVFLLS